ncbi:unnamed protein product [Medioppia subpectinata]|uniref:Peptidase S1 domain-containing protein n=1 Tax=Medioppia subpectinata TaxID=1979941 RepID=A0A7R9KZS9_9ACAR|nr:unnamed protein product [Medioppia subpectinata]CAG2112947.1 unnamed protein product [Medioppia subpectinata]
MVRVSYRACCAANCTVTDIRVYAGLINQSVSNHAYYKSGEYYINPTYVANKWFPYDLALIRLNTSIPLDGTSGLTGINAICLPEENVTNLVEEYALLNGFGVDNDNGTGSGVQRVGWTKIMKGNPDDSHGQNTMLYTKRVPFPTGSVANVTNVAEEYALLNGFGRDNDNGTGSGIQRVGWTKITKGNLDDSPGQNTVLYWRRVPFPTGTASCIRLPHYK